MSTKASHFFSADRPIERLDDDRLQRRAFALSIAQAITTWQGDDSLVMALYTKKDEPRGIDQSHVLTSPRLKELGDICVKAFARAAASDALKSHSQIKDILVWWDRWAAPSSAAKDYFRKVVATDDGLLTLLVQFLGGKLSNDAHRRLVDRLSDSGLSDFEQFMPADEIMQRVEEVSKKQTSEFHAKLCSVFMDVYRGHVRNRAGFPVAAPEQVDAATQAENPPTSPPKDDQDETPPSSPK